MKNAILVLLTFASLLSCKEEEKKPSPEKQWSTAEKIANANGFQNWKNVSELRFTFNVERDSTHFERSWIWHPKTEDITMVSAKDSVVYNRKSVDSIAMDADKAFINDKYWLLAPFQLIWDTSATISEPSIAKSPISNKKLNKITISYPNEGGYTPGDAYDLFYDDEFIVKEWNYRKGNAEVPTLSSTWEDYKDVNGLKIATTHNRPDVNWKLYFTGVEVFTIRD